MSEEMSKERQPKKVASKAGCLIWFNASVLYSAQSAGIAVDATPGAHRAVLVFLAVHGGLWAVYRALALIEVERQ